MKQFKREVLNQIVFGIIGSILLMGSSFLLYRTPTKSIGKSFSSGFLFGISGVLLVVSISMLLKIKNESSLKKLYIEKNDERRKHITYKVGAAMILVYPFVLSFSGIIFLLLFDEKIGLTLAVSSAVMSLIQIILYIWYDKKI